MELWALAKVANRASNGKTRRSCALSSIMICKLWWRTRIWKQTQTRKKSKRNVIRGIKQGHVMWCAFPLHGGHVHLINLYVRTVVCQKLTLLIASDVALLSIIYKELALLSLCFLCRQGGQPYQHFSSLVRCTRGLGSWIQQSSVSAFNRDGKNTSTYPPCQLRTNQDNRLLLPRLLFASSCFPLCINKREG